MRRRSLVMIICAALFGMGAVFLLPFHVKAQEEGAVKVQAAANDYVVHAQAVSDPKVVFATVESIDVVPARARIEGTIASISVKEGDEVEAGQEIALVGDEKLALKLKSVEAQIVALKAQSGKAYADLKRAKDLIDSGSVSKAELDRVTATAVSASNDLKALEAQRDVVAQQMAEGRIPSPSVGRVLQVPVTVGSVVMPGESVATIAAESYILRLRLPERHARFLKTGDKIHVEGGEMETKREAEGEISLVYPQIENGRVVADAIVPGLENFFVGERVRVWVTTGKRQAVIIPESLITTRSGIDYVRLKSADGQIFEVPVQRGQVQKIGTDQEVEILSGLREGDVLATSSPVSGGE